MSFQDNLDLLSMAELFTVYCQKNDYRIEKKDDTGVVAIVDKGFLTVEYYVTGCYNSGRNEMIIDIGLLEELKKFVELLQGKTQENSVF